MRTPICDRLGIEFPIFAFSHCRDVVAAVTNAGGYGVLGALAYEPERLEIELDRHPDAAAHGRALVEGVGSVGQLRRAAGVSRLGGVVADGVRLYQPAYQCSVFRKALATVL